MDAASSKPRKEDSEQNKATENGQGTEMWVPPDSESENEEITELDPEFKEEKSPEENSYSFGELNIGKTSSNEGKYNSCILVVLFCCFVPNLGLTNLLLVKKFVARNQFEKINYSLLVKIE